MLVVANSLGYTLTLLATFLGIGIVVGVFVFYIVAQVMNEHQENQERRERPES
jgi:ABC-type lipoprotein release transport system permease subunit